MRPFAALALALALTAWSSGPGGGGTAVPEQGSQSTTTTAGGDQPGLHGDVVVDTRSKDAPVRGTTTTTARGKTAGRPGSANGTPTTGPTPTLVATTTIRPGLKALGRVALFLDEDSPLGAYDPSVSMVIANHALVATVADDGTLALPFLEESKASALLAGVPKLADLEDRADQSRTIPLLQRPGYYMRAV